jgi:putative ABC transport system permease protein
MILDLAKLSGRNLFRRGKRSWLTIVGIVIGITAIVALFSLGQGLEQSVNQQFEDLGTNVIYVIPGSGLGGFFGGTDSQLSESDLEAVKRVQEVDQAGPMIYTQFRAEYSGEEMVLPVMGIPTDESQEMIMDANNLEVGPGRNLRDIDRFSGLAGHSLRQGNIFDSKVDVRSQIRIKDIDIRVVGLLEQSGDPQYDQSLFLPIEAARELTGEEDRIDFILAEFESGQEADQVAKEIRQELRRERNVLKGEENFTVSTSEDLIKSFLNILNLVQYVVIGIVSIALFVGGLGIMNTMYMSVNERTKEIGIMKALGAKQKQILAIYLFESGILGLIGGAIGTLIGLGISEIAFYFIRTFIGTPLQASHSPTLILSALSASFVLGILSGYLPARKAAKLEPVEAIRHE